MLILQCDSFGTRLRKMRISQHIISVQLWNMQQKILYTLRKEEKQVQAPSGQRVVSGDVRRAALSRSMGYTIAERVFIVRTCWQTGSFKHYQTEFLSKFGSRKQGMYSVPNVIHGLWDFRIFRSLVPEESPYINITLCSFTVYLTVCY
jgi:hypothetical protein